MTKVSVIMTTYNAQEHIVESLESALKQDIQNLEVLCVDGRSTDNTIGIIEAYAKKDFRVKLIYQERPGIGAAKNDGIAHATGEYITFLDADDFYVDKSALRQMYDTCKSENVAVCGAFRSTLFMDGRVETEQLHRNDCQTSNTAVRLRYCERPYDYHFHSYIYERRMIVASDARFAEVKAYDDTHFFIRAMLAAKEFCVVPVELYRYRCGPAYDWGMDKANDAILTLTDQLILTRENNIPILHWLTMQRINYEYGRIFVKNVLAGDMELLDRLVCANKEIDPAMIEMTEKQPPSEKWYLEPMMHRRLLDMPLRKSNNSFSPVFILEPLWLLMHQSTNEPLQQEINELKAHIKELERTIPENATIHQQPWLIRKFCGGIHCLKENGFRYTWKLFVQKIKNHLM